MGRYLDYLKLMWDSGAKNGKDLKECHKDKLKKIIKKKGEDKE